MASEQKGLLVVAPGIPIIEIDEDDSLHELWVTEWTEFDLPQYGPNWRFVLMSVVFSDGILEFALVKEYENQQKEIIVHMRGDRFQWDSSIVPNAIEMVGSLTPKEMDTPFELRRASWDPVASEYDCGIRKIQGSQKGG